MHYNAKPTAREGLCGCTGEKIVIGNCEGPETGRYCIVSIAYCGPNSAAGGSSCAVSHAAEGTCSDLRGAEAEADLSSPAGFHKDSIAGITSSGDAGQPNNVSCFDSVALDNWLNAERKHQATIASETWNSK